MSLAGRDRMMNDDNTCESKKSNLAKDLLHVSTNNIEKHSASTNYAFKYNKCACLHTCALRVIPKSQISSFIECYKIAD